MEAKYYLIPLLGFVIGYFTNYIAIKMLFRPRKKVFGIQGVIPKRRKTIAKKISDVAPKIMPERIRKLKDKPIIGPIVLELFKDSVEKQINSLSEDELEEMVLKVVKEELGFITLLGGIIGFLIGLVQVLVIMI